MNKTSRVLIGISIAGLLVSLFGFWMLENQSLENLDKIEVGSITRFENDTRLKRSENIHWYPINQSIKCYIDDLVFTGPDSKALIELSNGARIQLFENSLVSLSNDLISLESGVIEIDLSKSKGMKLESFGKEIPIASKSRVKIQQNKAGSQIVPLNDEAKTLLENPGLKNLSAAKEEINLLDPLPGTLFPKIPNYNIKLSWKSTSPGKDFQVDFYTPGSTEPILTKKASSENIEINTDKLPVGEISWKVQSTRAVSSELSKFKLSDETEVKLLLPLSKSAYPFPEEEPLTERFEWNSLFSVPFKFQLARNADFSSPIKEVTTQEKNLDVEINKDGKYFWRVGQEFVPGNVQWSKTFELELQAAAPAAPIFIKVPAKSLDFSLNDTYEIEIVDPNKSQNYKVKVFTRAKTISEFETKKNRFNLSNLDNGDYFIEVTGLIKNKNTTKGNTTFKVDNSPALDAPKIIKKKKKQLFVLILQNFMNLLFPTAHAQEIREGDGVVELAWEAKPGTTYEIEIYNENKKLLSKTQTASSEVNFKVDRPGVYLWRVRSKRNNQWSSFSRFDKIEAVDKVSLIDTPLMSTPSDQANIDLSQGKGHIVFQWETPYPEFTYLLELYGRENSTKPFKVYKVRGDKKALRFKNTPSHFWWKVVAISKYSGRSPNPKKYKFSISPEKERKPSVILLNANLLYTMSNYSQKVDSKELDVINSDQSLGGQTLDLYAEFWPSKWNEKHGIATGAQIMSLGSASNTYSSAEVFGEYARRLSQSEGSRHTGFLGLRYLSSNIEFQNIVSAKIEMPFASTRYEYQKIFTERYSMNFNAELMLGLQSEFIRPTVRVRQQFNYKLNNHISLNGLLEYRNRITSASYSEDDLSGDLTVTTQDISLGFGATWIYK